MKSAGPKANRDIYLKAVGLAGCEERFIQHHEWEYTSGTTPSPYRAGTLDFEMGRCVMDEACLTWHAIELRRLAFKLLEEMANGGDVEGARINLEAELKR